MDQLKFKVKLNRSYEPEVQTLHFIAINSISLSISTHNGEKQY